MYCDACGTSLEPGCAYCWSCGKQVTEIAPSPRSRLAGHLRVLGILWLVISAFRLLSAAAIFFLFTRSAFPAGAPDFVHQIFSFVGMLMVAGAVAGIVAGWGLLQRAVWARTLTVVLGCISLIDVPFGTMVGIYSLWVLLPADAEEEYRRMSRDVAVI